MLWIAALFWMNTHLAAQVLVSKPFDPYLTQFAALSGGLYTPNDMSIVDIQFSPSVAKDAESETAVGVCWYGSSYKIQIDPIYWNQNPENRLALVFHELGHCHCDLDHSIESDGLWLLRWLNRWGVRTVHSPFMRDGCPNSLMYPYVVDRRCLDRHFNYYMEDLFSQCRRTVQLNEIMDKINKTKFRQLPNRCER